MAHSGGRSSAHISREAKVGFSIRKRFDVLFLKPFRLGPFCLEPFCSTAFEPQQREATGEESAEAEGGGGGK
jgi:hypothetical protein